MYLPRDGQPDQPPLVVDRNASQQPWPTYSTSWASPTVGSSSSSPSSRAVTYLFAPAGEPGAPRQAEQPAACGRAGIVGVSGSGLMPCVLCVLPCPGTHWTSLCVSVRTSFASACVCRRTVCLLCLLCVIGPVLPRLCRAVHGLHGRVAVPGRAGAGTVLNWRVG